MMRAELRYWTPALLWSAVLLSASGNAGSGSVTGAALHWILSVTNVPVSDPTFEALHFVLRKSAHVIAYGILGALDFHAVRGGRPGWRARWSFIAVALAVTVAGLDEWHQSMFASRTGRPADVVIDCAGATLAQIVLRRGVRTED